MEFSKRELVFFDKAKNMSYLSQYKRIHIGSVAVYKGKIISYGANSDKSNPTQAYYNKFREFADGHQCDATGVHAEMKVMIDIKDMDIDFSKVELFVYRTNSLGQVGNCSPCSACRAMAKKLGIKRFYYTNSLGSLCYEEAV